MSKDNAGFSYEVVDGVAVLTVDQVGESVNTLSPESGEAFEALLKRAGEDTGVKAVVFISGKKDCFVAGAKIDFLQSLATAEAASRESRMSQEAFNRLAAFGKPVVAAIHGTCLGGGLEWAMACHYRIATDSPKTQLGLPEVMLGLLPGAGGTQRLPRLIGVQAALDLILTGKNVRAAKAKKLGLVDEVVPPPILKEVAVARARAFGSGEALPSRQVPTPVKGGLPGILKSLSSKQRLAELALEENPLGRKVLFEQAQKAVNKKSGGHYPAPLKALAAVRVGVEKGVEAGLKAESEAFGELVRSDVSRRLVELFFARNAAKKENGVRDAKVTPRKVEKLALLGGGLMGGGIAYVSMQKGIPVRIKERDYAGAGRALKHVRGLYDEQLRKKRLTWRERDAKMALVSAGIDYAGFKHADLVVEAVFEDLAVKHQVLKETEAVTREDCIFASNTSSLPITEIAKGSKRPETVIGMHYFSPVNKMPLLEIITHKGTADWVTATCVELGRKQGKDVIVVNDGAGFYTSRILAPYLNEAAYLMAEGADIAELDAALVKFGFPVGPVTLLDEVGIDVGEKVSKILFKAFGERMAPPSLMKDVVADGRLGRKAKKGFYTYDGKKKEVDTSVYTFLPSGKPKQLDRQEMAERCVLQMVNEAVLCLEESVLRSPRDGDLGAIFGLGFPPFLGGPFRYLDTLGAGHVVSRLEHWRGKLGVRFTPARLLQEKAKASQRFY
jgi:3-hydroxyacyl-CoA dehydrogenase/enoyl-CoA hydratase/3-hydroxybutyryl-CoA epimerase